MSTSAEKLFTSSLSIMSLDPATIQEARDLFVEYQFAGIIKTDCSFGDPIWYTTDEYANVGLHFSFNRFSYEAYSSIFSLSFNDFLVHVKAFLLSLFGRLALSTLQSLLLDLRHIIDTEPSRIFAASEEINISCPNHCEEFFLMLPNAEDSQDINRLIDAMESYADINFGSQRRGQRALASFETYFLFDDIIKDFWASNPPLADRVFYFPLYLWWSFTAVIPLRPREFLLTPRECLSVGKDDHFYLKVRRNRLKGGHRAISYRLEEDYSFDTHKITVELGKDIQAYIDITAQFDKTDIDTLFVTDPHYYKWGRKKLSASRFLSYTNMNTILKYFYAEVICGKYGYRIVDQPAVGHLADGEIQYIHLGDTRHIALINLMQQGGSPVTAMLLAGHSNTSMASHYYSNIKTLTEVKTYRQYRKLLSGNAQYHITPTVPLPETLPFSSLSDGGKCFSTAFSDGSIEDCLKTVGENGELGYCPACPFYRKNGISYWGSDDIYKQSLQEDCLALERAVSVVRKGKGCLEDIGEALLRLQASSASYEKYLTEKYQHYRTEGRSQHGAKADNR